MQPEPLAGAKQPSTHQQAPVPAAAAYDRQHAALNRSRTAAPSASLPQLAIPAFQTAACCHAHLDVVAVKVVEEARQPAHHDLHGATHQGKAFTGHECHACVCRPVPCPTWDGNTRNKCMTHCLAVRSACLPRAARSAQRLPRPCRPSPRLVVTPVPLPSLHPAPSPPSLSCLSPARPRIPSPCGCPSAA